MTTGDLHAGIARTREYLERLTALVQAHRADGSCHHPDFCPGRDVMNWIDDTPRIAAAVLAVALTDRATAATAAVDAPERATDSVTGTLVALNAEIVVDDDGPRFVDADNPKWRQQAESIVTELIRVGLVGGTP